MQVELNKKVLLRERKKHTDRGVSSTPSVTRGGVPPSRSYPLARSDGGGVPEMGYPPPGLMGEYLRWGTPLAGVTPWPGLMGGT